MRRRGIVAVAAAVALSLTPAVAAADTPDPAPLTLQRQPFLVVLVVADIPDTRPELDHRYRVDTNYRAEIAEQAADRARADRRRFERTLAHAAEVDNARQRLADRIAQEKAAAEQAAREKAAREAAARAAAEAAARAAAAWVVPVDHYRITATYGQSGRYWSRRHTGLDFAAPTGTPVRAVHACRVIFAGRDGAYGNQVECDHGGGEVTSYSHLSDIDVTVGQRVATGGQVGEVGDTGNVTGPHLHLEVEVAGALRDPHQYLTSKGATP